MITSALFLLFRWFILFLRSNFFLCPFLLWFHPFFSQDFSILLYLYIFCNTSMWLDGESCKESNILRSYLSIAKLNAAESFHLLSKKLNMRQRPKHSTKGNVISLSKKKEKYKLNPKQKKYIFARVYKLSRVTRYFFFFFV